MAMHVVEQKGPDEFVYPQDISVAGTSTLMRYGGLTKREYAAVQIAAGLAQYAVEHNVTPRSIGSVACEIADGILAALTEENVEPAPPESDIIVGGN